MQKIKSGITWWGILIPIVVMFSLLASGLPQRYLTMLTIGEEKFSIAQYHVYFYNAYYDFIADYDSQELADLGLDTGRSLQKQTRPDGTSWYNYFRDNAYAAMYEQTLLSQEARKDGFSLSPQGEDALAAEKDRIRVFCAENGISDEADYFTTYYYPGATAEFYYDAFARTLLAEEYRAYLLESSLTPDEETVAACVDTTEHSGQDYATANLVIITMEAARDRVTGQVEARQRENLAIRLTNLMQQIESHGAEQADFEAAAVLYSQNAGATNESQVSYNVQKEELPGQVAAWCFSEDRNSGDSASFLEENHAYAVYYVGKGDRAWSVACKDSLLEQNYQVWLEQRAITFEEHWLGVKFSR